MINEIGIPRPTILQRDFRLADDDPAYSEASREFALTRKRVPG